MGCQKTKVTHTLRIEADIIWCVICVTIIFLSRKLGFPAYGVPPKAPQGHSSISWDNLHRSQCGEMGPIESPVPCASILGPTYTDQSQNLQGHIWVNQETPTFILTQMGPQRFQRQVSVSKETLTLPTFPGPLPPGFLGIHLGKRIFLLTR